VRQVELAAVAGASRQKKPQRSLDMQPDGARRHRDSYRPGFRRGRGLPRSFLGGARPGAGGAGGTRLDHGSSLTHQRAGHQQTGAGDLDRRRLLRADLPATAVSRRVNVSGLGPWQAQLPPRPVTASRATPARFAPRPADNTVRSQGRSSSDRWTFGEPYRPPRRRASRRHWWRTVSVARTGRCRQCFRSSWAP